jgi:hypothetical protein
MSMVPTVTVEDEIVLKLLNSVEHALTPPQLERFLSDEVKPYLRERAEQRFDRHGDDAVGGRWLPLSPKTIELHGPHDPNVLTGDLHDFITAGTVRTGQQPMGASLELPGPGTSLNEKKVKVAQMGLNPNPISNFRAIPARPVLGVNERDTRRILERFGTWLEAEVTLGTNLGGLATLTVV